MPDWKKVIRDITKSIGETVDEVSTRADDEFAKRILRQKTCLFWDCSVIIRSDHFLCYDHFQDFTSGLIDECPGCNQAKNTQYNLCLKCSHDPRIRSLRTGAVSKPTYRWYKPEYSQAWEKGDANADEFFTYILKLDGSKFYAGHTRELRERLTEHRDGSTQSTVGRSPKLVWFRILPNREAATAMESRLKRLIDSNPRGIRRMINRFRDLVRELDYE